MCRQQSASKSQTTRRWLNKQHATTKMGREKTHRNTLKRMLFMARPFAASGFQLHPELHFSLSDVYVFVRVCVFFTFIYFAATHWTRTSTGLPVGKRIFIFISFLGGCYFCVFFSNPFLRHQSVWLFVFCATGIMLQKSCEINMFFCSVEYFALLSQYNHC